MHRLYEQLTEETIENLKFNKMEKTLTKQTQVDLEVWYLVKIDGLSVKAFRENEFEQATEYYENLKGKETNEILKSETL